MSDFLLDFHMDTIFTALIQEDFENSNSHTFKRVGVERKVPNKAVLHQPLIDSRSMSWSKKASGIGCISKRKRQMWV